MKLKTTSSYAAALRPALNRRVFGAAPLRLLWLPVHYAVLAMGTLATARAWLDWPLQLVLSLVMGASFAGLTFVGHEALHGAIVRQKFVRRLVGRLGFLPFAVPPRLWEAWHNRVHHGNTNRPGIDPDTYPTRAEYEESSAVRRATDWVAPGRRRLAGAFSLLVGFSVQSTHMLLVARGRQFLSPAAHRWALLEAGVVWASIGLLAFTLGPAAFSLAFVLPLVVGNTIIMSFILTNHNLSPQTSVNDPLVNSLSVSGPRFFEWLTLGFGFHVEHHLFPAVSGRHGRELQSAMRREWPERYQSLPYFEALLRLHRSPRVYQTDTVLIDPTSGRMWPTLQPASAEPGVSAPPAAVVAPQVGSNAPSRTRALALSLTAVACAGPALRTPQLAEAPLSQETEAQLTASRSGEDHEAKPPDAADSLDAHRSPPATTASVVASSAPGPATEVSDRDIVERIHAALLAEPALSAHPRIEAVSRSGRVFLSGPVASEAERTAVENAVKKVAGVIYIDSRLLVQKR